MASTVCALAVVPTIITFMVLILAVFPRSMSRTEQGKIVLLLQIIPIAYAAAAMAFYRMLRNTTVRKTWLRATFFIVSAASTPATEIPLPCR